MENYNFQRQLIIERQNEITREAANWQLLKQSGKRRPSFLRGIIDHVGTMMVSAGEYLRQFGLTPNIKYHQEFDVDL